MADRPATHTRVITGPQYEPVTLAEARLWCRVDDDDTSQDAVLMLLIGAMREYAENLTGRSFVQRTLETRMDYWPCDDVIELPFPPLVSVSYVEYLDGDGATQQLSGSPSAFQVDTHRVPGRVWPLYGASWPTALSDLDAVRIRYVAGYQTFSALPRNLKLWMNARLATLYENREQIVIGTIVNELPRSFVDCLLDSLVVATRIA